MDLISIFSEQTCGANCWLAQEDVCKCSCNGKNHGIALNGGNPEKIIKIDGFRYKLFKIGSYNDLYHEAWNLLKDSKKTLSYNKSFWYKYSHSDKGSPIRLKALTDNQKEWAEAQNLNLKFPYALWQKLEA